MYLYIKHFWSLLQSVWVCILICRIFLMPPYVNSFMFTCGTYPSSVISLYEFVPFLRVKKLMITCTPFLSAITYHGHVCSHMSSFQLWSYVDMGTCMVHVMFLSMIICQHVLVCLHLCQEQCQISVYAHVLEHVCCFHAAFRLNENGPNMFEFLAVIDGTVWED